MKLRLAVAAMLFVGACATMPGARDFEAGPIWNQEDAALKCPIVAMAVGGQWNGHWVTTRESEMSVCAIVDARRTALNAETNVEVGPIWNIADGRLKCPIAAAALRARWTGHWWTTREGEMSVCALAP